MAWQYEQPGSGQGPPYQQYIQEFEGPEEEIDIMAIRGYNVGSYRGELNQFNPNIDPALATLRTQQPPMARFVNEQLPRLFDMQRSAAFHPPIIPRSLSRPSAPINNLPFANSTRVPSPAPSYGLTSSTPSSAQSPPEEFDFYPEQGYYESPIHSQEELAYTHSAQFNYGQSFWSGAPTQNFASYPPSQSTNCVNMSQVQGFADAGDATIEADEGYSAVAEQGYHNEHNTIKVEHSQQANSYYTDEGIGSSVRDLPTPNSMAISHHDQETMDEDDEDMDAEGENFQEAATPAGDTEYNPGGKSRARQQRKSRAAPARNPLSANTKNTRVSKSTPKIKGTYTCKTCDAGPFKDQSSLAKHTATAHIRAFACIFNFAGCASTFGSKNEWKRHVQSQHLNLTAWVCTMGACRRSHGHKGNTSNGSEFNRKDLFTQHIRRMHPPAHLKKKAKSSPGKPVDEAFENYLKQLQVDCLVVKRVGPKELMCPVDNCPPNASTLCGDNALDDRMEHVGRHIEKDKGKTMVVHNEQDVLLVHWALEERIIEQKNGAFRLCVGGPSTGPSPLPQQYQDVDAEGEYDD